MRDNVIFTICAKNYLAQALTLKESVLRHNNDIDFFIFLADDADGETLPQDLVLLSEDWVDDWKTMAFKYDVVEFSTAIKPYAILKLFNDGYKKVSYIDPDIYVVNRLDYVFEKLDNYSAILTPHRCTMIKEGEFLDEHRILQNGIFNLGFFAVKNDKIGNSIVSWWKDKLRIWCYLDIWDGLAVDQKWMDFIPAYYPEAVLISSHLGMNAAIWNIQERQLFKDSNIYKIRSKQNPELSYDLLFWHFSGYSPKMKNLLCKGNMNSDFEFIPELLELGGEYYETLMRNEFEKYSSMFYCYNKFDNGDIIQPIHRRLFRYYEADFSLKGDPFLSDGFVYKILKKNCLISKRKFVKQDPRRDNDPSGRLATTKMDVVIRCLRFVKLVVGIDNYSKIIKGFKKLGVIDNHYFLIKNI